MDKLIKAIMESVSEGVVCADVNGTFVYWNEAATNLLGVGPVNAIDNWSEIYGLYKEDGSPIPSEDLPLVRALKGEVVPDTRLLVKNKHHPLGISIIVTAKPITLSSNIVIGMAVFHEVESKQQKQVKEELDKLLLKLSQLETAVSKIN